MRMNVLRDLVAMTASTLQDLTGAFVTLDGS